MENICICSSLYFHSLFFFLKNQFFYRRLPPFPPSKTFWHTTLRERRFFEIKHSILLASFDFVNNWVVWLYTYFVNLLRQESQGQKVGREALYRRVLWQIICNVT